MTISTRLRINILLSAAIITIMLAVFLVAFMVEEKARGQVSLADEITRGMYDLNTLTFNYIRHPEERPKEQWEEKYESLSKTLKYSQQILEQKDLIQSMEHNLEDLGVLFNILDASYENDRSESNRTGRIESTRSVSDTPVLSTRQVQIVNLILLRLRDISGTATRIAVESNNSVRETSRVIAVSISFFAFLILILMVWFSLRTRRAIADPIHRLGEGTRIIQAGNLDHHIDIVSNDELGQLSNSFNEMTRYLRSATVSRDELIREVSERKRTQEDLEKIRNQLEAIIDNISEGLVVSDLKGFVYRWNRVTLEMHGFSSQDDFRRKLPEFADTFELKKMDGTILPVDQWPLARVLRGETLEDLEIRICRVGSNWERIFSYGGTLVRFADGQPLLAVVTISDITERKRAEESLQRQAALIDLSPDGIFIRKMDGTISFFSHGAEAMYGWKREEAIGRKTHELLYTRFPEPLESINRKLMPTGRWSGELIQKTKDGRELVVKSFWLAQFDETGSINELMESNVDVTDLKRIEEALRARESDLSEAQRIAHIGSWYWDAKTDITTGSDELLKIYGFDPARQSMPDFKEQRGTCYPVEDWERVNAAVQRTLETGNGYELDVQVIRNRSVIWVTTRSDVVRDADNRIIGLRGTVQDITERKRAEEKIHLLNAELEQRVKDRTLRLENAVKELESFSYSISHDLKIPLRAIEGFSRILEEDYAGALDDEGKRVISVIVGNTTRMSSLIDDLLAFSRMGRYELKPEYVDMADMVRSVFNEIVPPQERDRIHFIVHPLPEACADVSLIHQVWTNLLSNAVKFSSGKENPEIEVGGETSDNSTLFYVKDNGVGFDMAYAGKLFGVFQRLHAIDEFPGTGVGLAIAKRIVSRHGGRIWAEASPGMGATFSFTLPVHSPKMPTFKEKPEKQEVST